MIHKVDSNISKNTCSSTLNLTWKIEILLLYLKSQRTSFWLISFISSIFLLPSNLPRKGISGSQVH